MPASCVLHCTSKSTGQLAPAPQALYVRVRVPASGVLYLPRTVAPQALTQNYFEQRQASQKNQGDGTPAEKSFSNLLEASAKHLALGVVKKRKTKGEDLAGQAVLLYSAPFKFSYFMDRAASIEGFSKPIWNLWPQDVMMQRVAAKEELKKLACNAFHPRASSAQTASVVPAPETAPGSTAVVDLTA